MSRLLLTGAACALPGAPGTDGPRIAPATLAIEGGRIAAVIEGTPSGTDFADFEPVDCSGRLILPGLINAHTHAVLLALRGTIEDVEGNLVYQYMVPVSYLLTGPERSAIARLACAEAIRSGTTTLVDPLRHVADYAPAMAASGLRLWLAESCADAVTTEVGKGTYRFDRAFGQTFLNRTEALIERFHNSEDGRVQVMAAAHGPDNCSPWMLEQVSELAARHGLRRTIHLSQIISEKTQVEALHGCTSTEYLARNGFLGDDLLAVHWTFCTEKDVGILAENGVHFIHSPASMSAKGPHPAPVKAIQEAGINIALGSDNMTEDMFQSMKTALVLHRGAWGRSVRPSPGRVFDYATVNAAKALDRPDLGRIAEGAAADLAMIDLTQATMAPTVSAISNLVHYGHPGLVADTMVAGRFLMRDRRLTTIDEPAAVAEAQAATRSMWTKFEAEGHDVPVPRFDALTTGDPA
ncbi:amidohydrolase family protein [Albimonas pacifica]|uniref:5-methylthioadenosine/S-adenosylhomocysteine deaminase n=1 Tax=Albimonas pacifica TaxID=1114924 RepID=A0A1I3E9I3_9RHOB|nr:amidohydrolase family protein [Albimonas pacifica]SFH95614.1 5-methylthioadenosine/S-adenosylhomocysteine deaminase [Albimonas pacifica]